MTQTTKKIIENIYASEVPLTKDSPLKWYKNHGKFIHEDLYRQHNQDLLLSIHATVKALNQTITALTILLKQADFALNQDIENETQRAEEAENQLQQEINNEIQRAEKVESQLQQEIDNEIQRAEKVENQLQQDINSETERAKKAESGLQQEINVVNSNLGQQLQEMKGQIAALKPNSINN